MADYPRYTKREFLKLMGLGLVCLPFISCFDQEREEVVAQAAPENTSDSHTPEISEADLLLLQRNDEAYETYNQGFNKRLHFLPKYIALCYTEKGIQFAVHKAKTEGLPIAVKSGGHSFEGFSSNNGGMVINLSQMKQITWLSDNEVLMEPGVLLQEIHAALFPKNKLLPAGSCGTVGIAGLTLGGGYGFFSRKYGLTCDSLLQVRLIAADGKVYDSNDDKELLWACKGGGNGNFGVVSSFRFKLYEAPKGFSHINLKFRNLDADRCAMLMTQWFALTADLAPEMFSAFVLNGKTLTLLMTTYGASATLEPIFAPLIAAADQVSTKADEPLARSMKRYYGRKGPINFKNASAGLYNGIEDLEDVQHRLFNLVVAHPGMVFQINTLGGHIADPAYETQSAYPHRAYPYLGELQAYWEKDEREPTMLRAFDDIQLLLWQQGIRAHYRNYPDLHFQDWETAYYGQNYDRLQEVKQQYDAEDLFRYPQSIRLKETS